MNAIETVYRHVKFRSRLEARWACMFDKLGWAWEYEPVDLNGYIPDFVLQFHRPLLVEAKPALSLTDLTLYVAKIEASGWAHEALIVGACFFSSFGYPVLGLLSQRETYPSPDGEFSTWEWAPGLLFGCHICEKPSVFHELQGWQCYASGCYDGDAHLGAVQIDHQQAWAEAGNVTRWGR